MYWPGWLLRIREFIMSRVYITTLSSVIPLLVDISTIDFSHCQRRCEIILYIQRAKKQISEKASFYCVHPAWISSVYTCIILLSLRCFLDGDIETEIESTHKRDKGIKKEKETPVYIESKTNKMFWEIFFLRALIFVLLVERRKYDRIEFVILTNRRSTLFPSISRIYCLFLDCENSW